MRTMRKIIYRLLFIKLLFALALSVLGYWYWLLNFELAFFASMFILFGSFSGYRRMVQKRLEAGEGADEDLLDEIEDPHGLYEDEANEGEKELSLKEIVQEEKKRLKEKRQTLKKTMKSTSGIFSPWRFLPYTLLVISFIGLNNNHILSIPAFLLGLAGGIVSAVLISKAWVEQRSTLE